MLFNMTRQPARSIEFFATVFTRVFITTLFMDGSNVHFQTLMLVKGLITSFMGAFERFLMRSFMSLQVLFRDYSLPTDGTMEWFLILTHMFEHMSF
jgi:membrane associated rhomboid family serine protease